MVPITRRMMAQQRSRYLLTVGGVGCTIWLMLFLSGVYEGVRRGATTYVSASAAELWVCQQHANNLLRSTSFLPATLEPGLRLVPGVSRVTGILRVLATTQLAGRRRTLFVFGFDPKAPLGAPAHLARGTAALAAGEMIIDAAFAARHGLDLGDSLSVQGTAFRVAGVSRDTNALVAQFAFVTLEDAQRLLALPGVVSFYLLTVQAASDVTAVTAAIRQRFESLAVFTRQEFVDNNVEEMETGVLPILWTISVFGVFIGGAVMALMLYGAVLEKREDYAVLRAIGAQHGFLVGLVLKQAVATAILGFALGLLLNFTVSPVLSRAVPELSLHFTGAAAAGVFGAALVIAALGAWLPVRKLRQIYPAEVFRA